jgi:8-oxo-dGTP diphosphatase
MKCPALPMFATLCYLRNRDKVLLLHKARGLFGEGKWNAPGGKLRLGENPSNGAAREMFEETGIRVNRLRFNGILNFYLGESKELDQTVFAFSCHKFTGKTRRRREGKLRWFPISQIPYDDMWEDDRLWLPLLLDGRSFIGDFYFTDKYQKLICHKISQTQYRDVQ